LLLLPPAATANGETLARGGWEIVVGFPCVVSLGFFVGRRRRRRCAPGSCGWLDHFGLSGDRIRPAHVQDRAVFGRNVLRAENIVCAWSLPPYTKKTRQGSTSQEQSPWRPSPGPGPGSWSVCAHSSRSREKSCGDNGWDQRTNTHDAVVAGCGVVGPASPPLPTQVGSGSGSDLGSSVVRCLLDIRW
jgi:hypothetical protein